MQKSVSVRKVDSVSSLNLKRDEISIHDRRDSPSPKKLNL